MMIKTACIFTLLLDNYLIWSHWSYTWMGKLMIGENNLWFNITFDKPVCFFFKETQLKSSSNAACQRCSICSPHWLLKIGRGSKGLPAVNLRQGPRSDAGLLQSQLLTPRSVVQAGGRGCLANVPFLLGPPVRARGPVLAGGAAAASGAPGKLKVAPASSPAPAGRVGRARGAGPRVAEGVGLLSAARVWGWGWLSPDVPSPERGRGGRPEQGTHQPDDLQGARRSGGRAGPAVESHPAGAVGGNRFPPRLPSSSAGRIQQSPPGQGGGTEAWSPVNLSFGVRSDS